MASQAEAQEAKNKNSARLLATPGVAGVGVNATTKTNGSSSSTSTKPHRTHQCPRASTAFRYAPLPTGPITRDRPAADRRRRCHRSTNTLSHVEGASVRKKNV